MAVGDFLLQQLLLLIWPQPDERHGGVLGNSGFLGSEALEEPLARPSAGEQLLQARRGSQLQQL